MARLSSNQNTGSREGVSGHAEEEVFVIPASFSQQGLWTLAQRYPESSRYNLPNAFRISGKLNPDALERSFNEIIRRHESFRTSLNLMDGNLVQVISPESRMPFAEVDLGGETAQEQESKIQQLLVDEANRPFDLRTAPFLRAFLLRLGPQDHVLMFNAHLIVCDCRSMEIMLKELQVLYEVFSAGNPSPLPELSVQYADFAIWQRQQVEDMDSKILYWKQTLGNSPQKLQLPTDRSRPAIQTYRAARQYLMIGNALVDSLQKLSREARVSLFMTLLAAFKTLINRYSGQDDIVVGSPIPGRTRETEGLIGWFVNNLVLRTDLSGNPTFRELLGRVRDVAVGAYGHQDLPYERMVEHMHPERDFSRNPLFQVEFNFQNTAATLELSGLTLTPLEVHRNATRFDLTLNFHKTELGLGGCFEYRTELFDSATITRMIGHYRTLLEGIVAHPDRTISELPLSADWKDKEAVSQQHPAVGEAEIEAPERQQSELTAALLEPSTKMECLIANMWRDLLSMEKIGKYDNFFELGGDSLLSTRAIDKLERSTGIRLNPMEFMFQTLSQIASVIEGRMETSRQTTSMNLFEKLSSVVTNRIKRNGAGRPRSDGSGAFPTVSIRQEHV